MDVLDSAWSGLTWEILVFYSQQMYFYPTPRNAKITISKSIAY
jgi:hypothetical protein